MMRQRHQNSAASSSTAANNKEPEFRSHAEADSERYSRLQSLFYVVLAIVVGWWANVPEALWSHPDTNRIALYLAVTCHFSFLLIFAYLSYYLAIVHRIQIDYQHWQTQAPRAIPVATALMVASWSLYVVAFWPVWSWLTVPILFVLLMGMLSLLSTFG